MCGVVAVSGQDEALKLMYLGMMALQHRGQDGYGVLALRGDELLFEQRLGLLKPLAQWGSISWGVGHLRYTTNGVAHCSQPALGRRTALAFNGHHQTTHDDDTQDLLCWLDENAHRGEDLLGLFEFLDGAASGVVVISHRLFAFRDPSGRRPLWLARSEEGVAVASETVSLQNMGLSGFKPIKPGTVVDLQTGQTWGIPQVGRPCVFEGVYFSHAHSHTDSGEPMARFRSKLARRIAQHVDRPVDVVVGVPNSGVFLAKEVAKALGVPEANGLVCRTGPARTFISHTSKRRELLAQKWKAEEEVFRGKRVLLVDDSLVRGATIREVMHLVESFGAEAIYLAVTCSQVRFSCRYGVDLPNADDLPASKYSDRELAKRYGLDVVWFLELDELVSGFATNPCVVCLAGE